MPVLVPVILSFGLVGGVREVRFVWVGLVVSLAWRSGGEVEGGSGWESGDQMPPVRNNYCVGRT